jgi:hypothetical protein
LQSCRGNTNSFQAHAKTYDWILQDPEVSEQQSKFSSWLAAAGGIFWISGKAGSGQFVFLFVVANFPKVAPFKYIISAMDWTSVPKF